MLNRSHRAALYVVPIVAMAAIAIASAQGAGASPAATDGQARVGSVPALPSGSRAVSALPAGTSMRVEFNLGSRDPQGLAQYAQEVSTPGSTLYRHYLTVGEFAEQFGATQSAADTVETALRSAGLRPLALSANKLSIAVSGNAASLGNALHTSFEQYSLSSGRVAYINTSAPQIASNAAGYVQSVVGLDDLDVPAPGAVPVSSRHERSSALRPEVDTGGPQPCEAASSTALAEGGYTADQLASAYRFSSLYEAGDLGAGQTVGLVEFEPDSSTDIAAFQSCYGTDASVSYVKVDGFDAKGAGSGEAALDIEQVISLAPDAKIEVYQAPNSGAGSYALYNDIVSQDTAKVISTSWGLCEALAGSATLESENTIFEEAAVQGQTFVAAAGDTGSEDCYESDGSTALSVDDPASQPYVTGVGGTSLDSLGPPPTETVWDDFYGGGGGGISTEWQMPSYQADAAASVGTLNTYSSGSQCGAPQGSYCREVPDVSSDADPATGIVIYWKGEWGVIGGTSMAAPTWGAFLALTNASSGCSGTPIGFANPDLYEVAGQHPDAFQDITSGENDVLGTNGGLYPALTGYDMASGLGSPDGAVLPGDLCEDAAVDPISIQNPGTQTGDVGQSVDLQIDATDSNSGQTLSYSASGLPSGLTIDSSSGLISGTLSVPGTSNVLVSSADATGANAQTSFDWLVAPEITSVKPVYGVPSGLTTVTIKGKGFTGTNAVSFGSSPATSFEVANKAGTKITAVSPAGTGTVFVTVTGPTGTSPQVASATFSFGPTVTKLSPADGATARNTEVTITGTNFSDVSAVDFGGVPATSFKQETSKKIVAYSPTGTAGPVQVTVTDAGGTSPTGTASTFTYN